MRPKTGKIILTALIVVLSLTAGCISKNDSGKIPAGWEEVSGVNREGNPGKIYQGEGTPTEAVSLFQKMLTDSGWKPASQGEKEGLSFAVLEREGREAVILARAGDSEKTSVYVMEKDLREEPAKSLQIPRQDAEGTDPAPLPRYPGSTRTRYEKTGNETLIEYVSADRAEKISASLAEQLASSGWQIQAMNTENRTTTIYCRNREGLFLSIDIRNLSGPDSSYTQIIISMVQ